MTGYPDRRWALAPLTDRPCTSTGDADGSGCPLAEAIQQLLCRPISGSIGQLQALADIQLRTGHTLHISPHHLCPPPLASCGVRMPVCCFSHRLNIFIYIICCWGWRGDIWARLRVCGLEVGSFHSPCVTPYPSSQASLHTHADHTSIHPSFHPFIHPSIHPHTYLACSAQPNSPPTHTIQHCQPRASPWSLWCRK